MIIWLFFISGLGHCFGSFLSISTIVSFALCLEPDVFSSKAFIIRHQQKAILILIYYWQLGSIDLVSAAMIVRHLADGHFPLRWALLMHSGMTAVGSFVPTRG